jgi:hypothetical protein
VDKPSSYFNTITYTGTGASLSVTGVGFQPDWVWIKGRSGATDHALYDAVRGVQKDLVSNATSAETTQSTGLTAFGSDGFTVGALAKLNTSSATYVAWNWKANGAGSSNTSGSITSTVSANTTSGFSIVSYTGNGTGGATVGHGLGVTPKMIIVKKRDSAGTDWTVWGSILGGTVGSEKIALNGTVAKTTGLNSSWFNNTAPTSTLFTIGTQSDLNSSGGTYIGYCFAEVKGFSKFGSYTGNGSADGTFVYTGFKPAWVMTKQINGANSWHIHDNKRNLFNVVNTQLKAESSGADDTPAGGENSRDFLSNGFKFRNADHNNQSGQTYIYMAFAESPFVSSKGLPCTAR